MSEKLFSEFPPTTTDQWEEQINIDLKGADYEKKLVWRTNEGINVRPYYRQEDLKNPQLENSAPGKFPYRRGKQTDNNNWQIAQDFVLRGNAAETNKNAVHALKTGATAVGFSLCGKGQEQQVDVKALLQGIEPNTPTHWDGGINSEAILKQVLQVNPKATGSLFYDPLSRLATCGNYYSQTEFPTATCLNLMKASKDVDVKVLGVDAAVFQNAGASLVQELAFALSMGSEYIARLVEAGATVKEVAAKLHFRMAVGSNYFMEIAKIRAARMLWANIVKAYDATADNEAKMFLHAETAAWNTTIYDPHVNLLRTATEAMSAAIAGIDALWVRPFDAAYKKSDEFSDRIARNQQIILKKEAYMDKIVDPAAGSYYIENLTDGIADKAWELFLQIEDLGGFTEAMKKGFIQEQVAQSAAKRAANIASRKEVLLGTNQYPNTLENVANKIEACKCAPVNETNKVAEPIAELRLGEAFEELRLRTENSGKQPIVFLLTIGNLTMRKARAGFAANFFSVAGYKIMDNNGFSTLQEGLDAANAANADIIVLCSSDDEYTELVPQLMPIAPKDKVMVLAGYPKATVEELKSAGMQNFIYAGQNVLEALNQYQTLLGIK